MADVTLPAPVAEMLIAGHLNILWRDNEDGCCSTCCGPCWALKTLLDAGRLDALVRDYGRGCSWWNQAADEVDREWLAKAWRETSCHEDETVTTEETES